MTILHEDGHDDDVDDDVYDDETDDDDDDDDVGNDDDDDTNDAMKTRAHRKKISEQRRDPAYLSHAHMASSLESNPRGGYSLIWAI